MTTIVTLSQKGGSGKTTFTVNISVAALQDGCTPGIVDADPQGSLRRWRTHRPQDKVLPRVASLPETDVAKFPLIIKEARSRGISPLIVDTAPRLTRETRALAEHADLLVIPVKPRQFDYWAVEDTLQVIQELRDRIPCYGVISEAPPFRGIAESTAVKDMVDGLREFGIVTCPTPLRRREEYDMAASAGLGVQEFAPKGKGAYEVEKLWRWLVRKAESHGLSMAAPGGSTPAGGR